jgi:hypothetical protein
MRGDSRRAAASTTEQETTMDDDSQDDLRGLYEELSKAYIGFYVEVYRTTPKWQYCITVAVSR